MSLQLFLIQQRGLPFNHHPKELDSIIPYGLLKLEAKIIDADGNLIAKHQEEVNLIQSSKAPFHRKLQVINPHLW